MTINVVISMDKVPSKDNRRIMQYLLSEVDTLKQTFNIRVNIIPRQNKGQPEAVIQIGQKKPVFGYARIIPELKAAIGRVAAVAGSEDPFLNFMTQNIGSPQDDMNNPATSSEKEMTSAFTRASSEREKRNQLQKPSKPGAQKNGELPKVSMPSISSSIGGRSGARPPAMMTQRADEPGGATRGDALAFKKYAANARSGGYAGDPSNSDVTDLGLTPGMDPVDAKFWSNQFTTAGI